MLVAARDGSREICALAVTTWWGSTRQRRWSEARSKPSHAALVTCVNVLQHVANLDAALAEIARVLASDGVLVAAVVHPIAEAATYDHENDELTVRRYFSEEARRVLLGEVEVVDYHRTIESYVRA